MTMLTAEEYRESLRRYRPRVFVDGDAVDSVADEPRLAPGIAASFVRVTACFPAGRHVKDCRGEKGPTLREIKRAGSPPGGGVVLYARVSSHDQQADLDRQVARLTAWAAGQGVSAAEVVTEVGAGVQGKRPKLRRLLADPQATMIVVERRDRLARFGVEHLEAALSAQGRRLVLIESGETSDDLVQDMIEVLTGFCTRLYGRRGARNRAMRAVTCARRPPEPSGDGQDKDG